jgi:hypothetical protein
MPLHAPFCSSQLDYTSFVLFCTSEAKLSKKLENNHILGDI